MGFNSSREKPTVAKDVPSSSSPAEGVQEKPLDPGKQEEEIKDNLFSAKNLEKAKTNAVVDAVFLCDCTGSMSNFIKHAKATIVKMVDQIRAKYTDASIFVGFIGYRDHCDKNVVEFIDLNGDMEQVYQFINKLYADGGGDEAEAVADALQCAFKQMTWREGSLKLLLHILDAPPHGKEFGASSDNHPKGCPCGVSCQEMLEKLDKMDTQYLILKYHDSTSKMVEVFKKHHKNIKAITLDVPAPEGGYEPPGRKTSECDMCMCSAAAPAEESGAKMDMDCPKRIERTASFCAAENMINVAAENVMEILDSKVDKKQYRPRDITDEDLFT